jgi:hypothetical protein
VFRDLRCVYVTFAADTDYVKRCFKECWLINDDTGNYLVDANPSISI